jgi:hypothetical protein
LLLALALTAFSLGDSYYKQGNRTQKIVVAKQCFEGSEVLFGDEKVVEVSGVDVVDSRGSAEFSLLC